MGTAVARIHKLSPRRRQLLAARRIERRIEQVQDPKRRRLLQEWLFNRHRQRFAASAKPVDNPEPNEGLTRRYYPLRFHPVQYDLWTSTARFRVVPAGRRSGKTELAKRYIVATALNAHAEARFLLGAPTTKQAKRIWWDDVKKLIPPEFIADKRDSDGERFIRLVNGAEIWIVGLDAPERAEGTPWDGAILDEFANMHPDVWDAHLRPVFAERGGWCWFIGVPEGRGHYWKLYKRALAEQQAAKLILTGDKAAALKVLTAQYGSAKEARKVLANGLQWAAFHWVSADILPAHEIEAAKRDMAPDLYEQEFEARFTAFRGRAYKPFRTETHTAPLAHLYDPRKPLVFGLDFNVEPGVAVVAQEMQLPSGHRGTGVIGEVHITYDSDSEKVARKLVADWEGHAGPVHVYGDATGGSRKTAAKAGDTDWKIVKQVLHGHFSRIVYRVPKANPPERARLNAMNSRLQNTLGEIRLMVDPMRAPHQVDDLEGVRLLEGGSGEIAKSGTRNAGLTHHSDALGYYVEREFPVRNHSAEAVGEVRLAAG